MSIAKSLAKAAKKVAKNKTLQKLAKKGGQVAKKCVNCCPGGKCR